MVSWLSHALRSSVGRKALLALTGFLLVGYLIVHLAGNLTLFGDPEGVVFDGYAEKLAGYGLALVVAEVLLAALFIGHVALALRLAAENREARGGRYAIRSSKGQKTAASASMVVTGLVVAVFLVKHVLDFRFGSGFKDAPAASVKALLSEPFTAIVYIVGVVALTVHLSHGFRSAFQSVGLNHPKYNALVRALGLGLALLLGLGFLSFPVFYLMFWKGDAA